MCLVLLIRFLGTDEIRDIVLALGVSGAVCCVLLFKYSVDTRYIFRYVVYLSAD